MAGAEVEPLSEGELSEAVFHYVDCLNLPVGSQVLIITDQATETESPQDPNVALRRTMSARIFDQLSAAGYRVGLIGFTNSMSYDEIYNKTRDTLSSIDENDPNESSEKTSTVVYLGESWDNRTGLYRATSDFGEARNIRTRIAGSLGFSTGDGRVMSHLTNEKRGIIEKTNAYFESFFTEHPVGTFAIMTHDEEGRTHQLEIPYDTRQSPFETDMGAFDDRYQVPLFHSVYVNIPGGERFGSPFPFRKVNGDFIADGIHFHVTDGLVDSVDASEEHFHNITDLQQNRLIGIIRGGGKMPVSELGLGFYAIAGIKTYPDSSVLSREKKGPHIGMGTSPSETPEAAVMERVSGDFHHTDFVMDYPEIDFVEPDGNGGFQFYPPVE